MEKCTKVLVSDSSSGIGCTTYDLTDAAPNKGDLPIGIVIPRNMNNNDSDENLANEGATVATTGDERFSKDECLHYRKEDYIIMSLVFRYLHRTGPIVLDHHEL